MLKHDLRASATPPRAECHCWLAQQCRPWHPARWQLDRRLIQQCRASQEHNDNSAKALQMLNLSCRELAALCGARCSRDATCDPDRPRPGRKKASNLSTYRYAASGALAAWADVQITACVGPGAQVPTGGRDLLAAGAYFRGLPTNPAQRLHRLTWLLSFAPHLGQRRALSWWTNFVRGRVFMAILKRAEPSRRQSPVV